jgi:ribonuclease P protein component
VSSGIPRRQPTASPDDGVGELAAPPRSDMFRGRLCALRHPAAPVARLTLPSGSHVRRSKEIRRAFDRGRSGASREVVVYAFDRADGQPPRYGLVVGRKWGDAVTRNRVRRLLRESFRTARPSLPAGFDFLLLPRGRLHGLRMQDVREMLIRAAAQAARRVAEEPRPPEPAPS